MLCFKIYFNNGLIGPVLKFCKGFLNIVFANTIKYFENSK